MYFRCFISQEIISIYIRIICYVLCLICLNITIGRNIFIINDFKRGVKRQVAEVFVKLKTYARSSDERMNVYDNHFSQLLMDSTNKDSINGSLGVVDSLNSVNLNGINKSLPYSEKWMLNDYVYLLSSLKGLKETALVFRQSDLIVYSNLTIQNFFDDKSISILNESGDIEKFDYIIANNYNDPGIYRTRLGSILHNYESSSLMLDCDKYKVFAMKGPHIYKGPIKNFSVAFGGAISKFGLLNVLYADFAKYTYFGNVSDVSDGRVGSSADISEFYEREVGVYDNVWNANIYVERETKIDVMQVHHADMRKIRMVDSLFLTPGENKVSSRFLSDGQPFILILKTGNDQLKITNSQVSSRKSQQLFSKDFVLLGPTFHNKFMLADEDGFYRFNGHNMVKSVSFVTNNKIPAHTRLKFKGVGNCKVVVSEFGKSELVKKIITLIPHENAEFEYDVESESFLMITFHRVENPIEITLFDLTIERK